MRYVTILLSLMTSVYMDTIFFGRINLWGIRPDVTLAVIVSIGVLTGGLTGAISGAIIGLVMDSVFGGPVGISAIGYMIAGAVGGIFFRKFYADNVIIPGLAALLCAFFKEHVTALAVLIAGGTYSYFDMFIGYILPGILLTGGMCMLVHAILKPVLFRQSSRQANRRAGSLR